jgi:spoIIIJ-associated protein
MTDYSKIEIVKTIITELLEKAGIPGSVEFEESITKGLVFNIGSPDSFLLIGRQGATLHSLQVLVRALAAKKLQSQEPFWFTLDVDDYKRKREWFLKETAKAAVEKAKMTSRAQALEPMPNYERRLVHAYLQEHCPEAESSSIGNEPYRKVVIRLKR